MIHWPVYDAWTMNTRYSPSKWIYEDGWICVRTARSGLQYRFRRFRACFVSRTEWENWRRIPSGALNIRDVLNPKCRPRHTLWYKLSFYILTLLVRATVYTFYYICLFNEPQLQLAISAIICWKLHFPLHKFEDYTRIYL